ncbi:MAG TPA: bifunctional DNA primase/polymerase [Candidatus Dormibacteraeota bacterium]|nr:bifunctional DNA primase/polymerase [Candidatus Dormibacteraeota bacterium]
MLTPAPAPPGLLLRAAQRYAARGWPVLPLCWPLPGGACACGHPDCSSPGKHPLVRRGLHAASADPERVRRWWGRWPWANVGIRTGAASGLLVLDVDGEAGLASLRALAREHGRLRAAWARSGSGGWHAYLRLPEGRRVPSSVGRLGPGLDVRAEGSTIVAPPSLHASGRRYRWLRPALEPPPAPAWLLELAAPPPPLPAPPPVLAGPRAGRYVEAAIRGEAEAVARAPVGTRNQRLNLAAFRLGRLVAAGLADEVAVREALLAAADAAGLPRRESLATVRSGLGAGMRAPRTLREPPGPALRLAFRPPEAVTPYRLGSWPRSGGGAYPPAGPPSLPTQTGRRAPLPVPSPSALPVTVPP